ncbi:STAS domain-containing protein [Streptomyces sp. NPDC102462]|uniref:STAS domain-containing protein n=1 Tax=Streptomyces sp. NPDC102462 TaxID=3366178 RepID=UPI0038290947
MALSRLDIHRRNRGEGALVTLAGAIGPATAPLLRAALAQCLRDGVTVIDVDLTTVGSCDARGLDVFLSMSQRADRVHTSLRFHHPYAQITRLLAVTGSTPCSSRPPRIPCRPRCPATSWKRPPRVRRPTERGRLRTPLVNRSSKTDSDCVG